MHSERVLINERHRLRCQNLPGMFKQRRRQQTAYLRESYTNKFIIRKLRYILFTHWVYSHHVIPFWCVIMIWWFRYIMFCKCLVYLTEAVVIQCDGDIEQFVSVSKLTAGDRFHTTFCAFGYEINDTHSIINICECHCARMQFSGALCYCLDRHSAISEAKIRVDIQIHLALRI